MEERETGGTIKTKGKKTKKETRRKKDK